MERKFTINCYGICYVYTCFSTLDNGGCISNLFEKSNKKIRSISGVILWGQFDGKINAEFTPPKTWVLNKSLSFISKKLE